jgi:hypothetical protein
VVAQALKPSRRRPGAAALQNTLQLGLCFLTSLLVSALIATPLLTTTSVMLVSIGWPAGLSPADAGADTPLFPRVTPIAVARTSR